MQFLYRNFDSTQRASQSFETEVKSQTKIKFVHRMPFFCFSFK